jgi:hypothetical protein
MLPNASLHTNPINDMTAECILIGEQIFASSHVRRLMFPTAPSTFRSSDAAYQQLLADLSEHTVCKETAHDSRRRKGVDLARRYRLSIFLSPTHRAVCPDTRLSRIPAIPDRQPCKHAADQSYSSVFNSSGASQLFGVSFSPSEKIVDTAFFGARPVRPMRAPFSQHVVCVIRTLLCSD